MVERKRMTAAGFSQRSGGESGVGKAGHSKTWLTEWSGALQSGQLGLGQEPMRYW